MSFSNSFPFPASNHSLYTPSYTADDLVPITCQELTSGSSGESVKLPPLVSLPTEAPVRNPKTSTSITKGSTYKNSTPFVSNSDPKVDAPVQYQKLKMNYLRRLNVIPIISQKDVLAVLDEGASLEATSKKTLKKESRKKLSGKERSGDDSQVFVPSFLPTPTRASQPIPIPQRSKKPSRSLLREEFEKGDLALSYRKPPMSVAADHFGVFFSDFEL